ncbi:MAG: hypothetical protein JO372_25000 [Solirubrobacterales bacterium]|nr:hypothetical protein [Solirubrobacterales bacterium]
MTTTDTQISPFIDVFGDARTELVEGAAEIARQSINTYSIAAQVLGEQQRLNYRAFQQWISGVANAHAQLRQRLMESYGAASSELIEVYEKGFQSGETVLQKVVSSRGHEPVPGYDELNVQEIQKLLADSDVELATRVRDYERPRKRREGVLHAADAQLSKA